MRIAFDRLAMFSGGRQAGGRLLLAALMLLAGVLLPLAGAQAAPTCTIKNSQRFTPLIEHNLSASYCELCGYGYVTIEINNPYRWATMTDLQLTEQLHGLVYEPTAPNALTYRIDNGPLQTGISVSGSSTLTFGNLPELPPGPGNQARTLAITFAVRRVQTPEALIYPSNRRAEASLSYGTRYTSGGEELSCGTGTAATPRVTIPLREPVPVVSKTGWNYSAGQRQGSASDPVYGNNNDDVVWRIRIDNVGNADLQDLRFDDLMQTGNMVVGYACPSAASADAIAANGGVRPGGSPCVTASNSINDFIVTAPFGQGEQRSYPWGDSYEVDVRAGGSASVYLVGKITANGSCITRRVNSVTDVQWGCDAQPPAGGIAATSRGHVPGATARLFTRYMDGHPALRVERQLTGTNTAQPVGTKGTMTIRISNVSGGSIRFSDALPYHLRDTLPPQYVVDPTFTPRARMAARYGSYDGMVDGVTWTNPVAGTFPLETDDPSLPLGNTAPEFRLWSSTSHPQYADQRNMMRHGDVLTVTFRVVLIDPTYYDRTANLDVTPEVYTGGPDATDPPRPDPLRNELEVLFDTFCAGQGTQEFQLVGNGTGNPGGGTVPVFPEDLDIAIGGDVFILTNDRSQELTLPVRVTNNGGHDARDFNVFITFGATMDVVGTPAGCALTSLSGTPPQPQPWQVWLGAPDPADAIGLPATASVYRCSSPAAIAPGQTVSYDFRVVKTEDPARLALDDLTFRADVIGEITLSDGTPLWFPAPQQRADGILDRANNYTLDTVWARVIGFNLMKTQAGVCSENNPPIIDTVNGRPVERVEIGEECRFDIQTGGWFGFETPGFAYIAVQNINVVDQVPDGQAYISSTDPYAASTDHISGVSLSPSALQAVDEGWFDWRFNVSDAERIERADEWFRVNVTTRLLNKALNERGAPNVHGARSRNILNSTFDATFMNRNTGAVEQYPLGPDTVGYPHEPIRRVDLTVTEPHVEVVKEVCNESLHGSGPACGNWTTHTAEGDAYDSYLYRITVRNRASVGGLQSAPAYDLIVTSVLDPSDLLYVVPFADDGLDNDGDGLIGAADPDEGHISDNVVLNGVPAEITFAYTHSSALRRLDPGEQVQLYYRVDPDERAAPMQALTNHVSVSYDSLEGGDERPSGNQTVDPRPNGDIGGARVYLSEPASAVLQILPLQTFPKRITRLAVTPLASEQPQPLAIGEELEYRLEADLPVALLRDFRIEDRLPAGLRCTEAPVVDLSQPPYAAAGFTRPGGAAVPPVTPECGDEAVRWVFGDVVLTQKPAGAERFRFPVEFIARLDNIDANRAGHILSNGVPATSATLDYIDENGVAHTLEFAQVDAVVAEPRIELSKTVAPAGHADAADRLTVTVTASNTGSADAYNLRILDDLHDRQLTFIAGSVSGNDPNQLPDTVDLAGGAKQPVFVWNPDNPLAPGASLSFSYQLEVDLAAQPQEILASTVEAAWTSLPGQTSALNSAGQIGADGSVSGLRNGALPNAGDPLNDYEAAADDASVSVPPPVLDKRDDGPDVVPTIGAHKRFTLEIALPEGTSRDLRIEDRLDAGAVGYRLTRDGDFDIDYEFHGIASINGEPPSADAFRAIAAEHDATGPLLWDIGEVVTEAENDIPTPGAIAPRLVIGYYARVNNDLQTARGERLRNAATLRYRHGETGDEATLEVVSAEVTVVEPLLAVTKAVFLDGEPVADPVQGGNLLEYRVSVVNNGDATAWDVNIVDALPPQLQLEGQASAELDGVPVAGFEADPDTNLDGHRVWGRDNDDDSLVIPPGATLVLSYAARVTEASGDMNNTVWVDWTSLTGESPYERHGAGCPVVSAPDEYCVSDSSPVRVVDTTRLEKFFVEDSYASGASTADDGILRVGDTATYRLVLHLEGVITRDVRVEDVLPAGMAFDAVLSINGDPTPDYQAPSGSPFTYAPIAPAQLPASGETGSVQWQLGSITASSAASFEIVYRARVVADAGIPHQPELALVNTAYLHYTQANGEPAPAHSEPRLHDSAALSLRQPLIAAIAKTERSGLSSPASVDIAGDTMAFRLEACNADGLAPAYDVLIVDDLPPELDVAGLTAPVVTLGGSVLAASDYDYTPPAGRGGSLQLRLGVPLAPAQCLTVDYDIGFHLDIPANSSWDNSATLVEYWSLPGQGGQRYGPLGPASFTMQNPAAEPGAPAKTLVSAARATIGELVEYRIAVPATPLNAALYDVVISDVLDPRLELVAVEEVGDHGLALAELAATEPGEVRLALAQIPAGQQAVVRLLARVANIDAVRRGGEIVNSADYWYRVSEAGDPLFAGSASAAPLRLVEPALGVAKQVANLTDPGRPPVAGDTLRYTVSLTAAGGTPGDDYADAFDLSLFDSLSLGLAYLAGSASVDGGNAIADPAVTGDGLTVAQTLTWQLADGSAAIAVAAGAEVRVVYDVRVLDNVLPNQTLSNSVVAEWTGLAGPSEHQRDGSGTPSWNDYRTGPATAELTIQDVTSLSKTRLGDSFDASADLRVGDRVDFELRLGLQEGSHGEVVVTDELPRGLAFEGVLGVDRFGSPVSLSPSVDGDPAAGPTTLRFALGDVVNPGHGDDNYITIVYRARVLNEVHPQVDELPLTNQARLDYQTATGPASLTAEATISLRQPRLAVTKAVVGGGDPELEANQPVSYAVELRNTGTAPAYDAVLVDTLPPGLREAGVTTLAIELVDAGGAPLASLPTLAPNYDPATGVATWDLDGGLADAYTIPAGQALRLTYQVTADAGLGAGLTLTNAAHVERYYSFDSHAVPEGGAVEQRQRYGPSASAEASLTTPAPAALRKANTQPTAAVGEPFSYRITVPAVPVNTALYDVRIVDDLGASAAELEFVGVSKLFGSQDWTPVNVGSGSELVIVDPAAGIDIPAGEQAVLELTVVLRDSPVNVSGLLFDNTASYSYHQVKGDPASLVESPLHADTSADMTIVGPDTLRLQKDGPATMRVGSPDGFRIVVENTGSGPAWGITVNDRLPVGMCASAPSVIGVEVEHSDGSPVSVLTEGSDYTVAFAAAPDCLFSLTLTSAAAAIGPAQRLVIDYQAALDGDVADGSQLTNVAAATRWYGADPALGGGRQYTGSLTDGTPSDPDDEQDAHTVLAQAPVVSLHKTVVNLSSGEDPGLNAGPGDTLRYTLELRNESDFEVSAARLVDHLSGHFAADSLRPVSLPAGADASHSEPAGGSNGTGLLDVRGLSLGRHGEANDSLSLVFEATLAAVIPSGSEVLNQARLSAPTLAPVDSNQTVTVVRSAPAFEVLKTSQVMSGDPDVLMAGEVLRYTLRVRNVGSEDAVNVVLRDPIPVHTRYVPDSTRLNGQPIADPAPGVSALEQGMPVHAPTAPTPGLLRADPEGAGDAVATVTFEVRVDPDVVDGTVVANQGFVVGEGNDGPTDEQPSDDPRTAQPNDPTRDIVGNLPLLGAHKTVALEVDLGSPGVVDPGDTLRYTIRVDNFGATPASGVRLLDDVPAHTTYVADSLRLNGQPLAQPDGGVSPLVAGIALHSADQAAGSGVLSPGGHALVTFDVRVDDGVAAGTLISNQGSVVSNELPSEPTDADGDPSNGHQPTVVVVGDAQQLLIDKQVLVAGGGAAEAGSLLEYVVTVTNIGTLPALGVVISDDLAPPLGELIDYVADSARLDGASAGVSLAGDKLYADYAAAHGELAPGASAVLRFQARIAPELAAGTRITNTAEARWNDPAQTVQASASIDVGGVPGSAMLNGRVWHDANFDKTPNEGERKLAGWTVELQRNGQRIGRTETDALGGYGFRGLSPNAGGADRYELHFIAPGAGASTALLGWGDSPFSNAPQAIGEIVVGPGANLQDLNLPIEPNGVVYDAVYRAPLAGASLTLRRAGAASPLPESCFDDPGQQGQVTGAHGWYKFDLNFSSPACPAGGDYLIEVTPPASGYGPAPSRIIPPLSGGDGAAFAVPACAGSAADAVPATAEHCEIQVSELAPGTDVAPGAAGTAYHLHLQFGNGRIPGHSQVFNNHIPVDPELDAAIAITKTSPLVNVSRGQLVPYTITAENTLDVELYALNLVDTLPPGFKYVEGSARLDGRRAEPVVDGRELTWEGLDFALNQQHRIELLAIVGAGVAEGRYVNRAQVFNAGTGEPVSGEASATVRVVPDPTFDCTDIIGKVFDDANLNGRQDPGEAGIAGVRIVSARGLVATTDQHGRFHITCAAVPDEERGSNFILKLDDRSLPAGYRVTTENPLVQRATRGKLIKFNFGATIHRVVGLSVADDVFEPGGAEMREHWRQRYDLLLDELQKSPSILRITYLADVEDPALVRRRIAAVRQEVTERWEALECCQPLTVETETFWRRGAPPERRRRR